MLPPCMGESVDLATTLPQTSAKFGTEQPSPQFVRKWHQCNFVVRRQTEYMIMMAVSPLVLTALTYRNDVGKSSLEHPTLSCLCE